MTKRCPPGVLCIENITIAIIAIVVAIVILFLNLNVDVKPREVHHHHIKEKEIPSFPSFNIRGMFPRPSDVLLNPYAPPLRDDRYSNYRQVGILTRANGDETILPLMGRPLLNNRDKWNFYTLNDKNNMIKYLYNFKCISSII